MSKRLTENISSLYIGAANRLKPKKTRRKIIAYVESYDDIAFWRSLLADYEDSTRYFEVMLPSQTSLAKGKKTVLMNKLGNQLGKNMIACVDSDYDYLLQGRTPTSKYMIENPYVLQTYAYAIENYLCYAEGLHQACVTATLNDNMIIDLVEFMKIYSQIAYPLFVWSIWFYRHHILSEFSLLDFCSYVKLDHVSTVHPEDSLAAISKRVSRKLKDLEKKHPEGIPEIEKMKKEFPTLGVFPENTYMFIQGHHIMNNVVLRLLIPVCTFLRREREQQIYKLAVHNTQLHNELTSYEHSQVPVETVLHKNTYFKHSPLYKMIQRDIENFLELSKHTPCNEEENKEHISFQL